eukprot:TRINITY_DN27893_c0_g1_i1.p1 TRINITY_DN27893_c0_g1~~TRINITY_DN27893_c0_g1_i1.p1  ORF type:complete len:1026 (-),score=120.93 TRINITY_DN27893_c0_g1_i1:308-3385(-)
MTDINLRAVLPSPGLKSEHSNCVLSLKLLEKCQELESRISVLERCQELEDRIQYLEQRLAVDCNDTEQKRQHCVESQPLAIADETHDQHLQAFVEPRQPEDHVEPQDKTTTDVECHGQKLDVLSESSSFQQEDWTQKDDRPRQQDEQQGSYVQEVIEELKEDIKEGLDVLASTVDHVFLTMKSEEDEYKLSIRLWDAMLIYDVWFLGVRGVIGLSFILVLYLMVLGMFLAVVTGHFVENDFDSRGVGALNAWRTQAGHSVNQEANGQSLVARLCGGDVSLATSARQVGIWQAVNTYTGTSAGNESAFNGAAMAMASMTVWMLILAREYKSILRFIYGLASVNRGRNTEIALHDGNVKINQLGYVHFTFICCCTLLRSFCATVLAYAGTLFIVHEVDMKDLLLNCAALEIVLTLDILIFEVMAPEKINRIVEKTLPLQYKRTRRVQQISAWSITVFMVVAVSFASISLFAFWQGLEEAKWSLCGGERDFVYDTDVMGVAHVRTTDKYDGPKSDASDFISHLQGTSDPNGWKTNEEDGISVPFANSDFEIRDTSNPFKEFWRRVHERKEWVFDHRFKTVLLEHSDTSTYPIGEYSMWHCMQAGVTDTVFLKGSSIHRFNAKGCFSMKKEQYCKDYAHLCHALPLMTVSCPDVCGCYSPFTRPDVPGMFLPIERPPLCPGIRHAITPSQWGSLAAQCEDFPYAPGAEIKSNAYSTLMKIYMPGAETAMKNTTVVKTREFDVLLKNMLLPYLRTMLPHSKNFAAQVHTLSMLLKDKFPEKYEQLLDVETADYGTVSSTDPSNDPREYCSDGGWHHAGNETKLFASDLQPQESSCDSSPDFRSLGVFFDESSFLDMLKDVPLCYLPFLFHEWCLLSSLSVWCPEACDCARLGYLTPACRLLDEEAWNGGQVVEPMQESVSATWLCASRFDDTATWPSNRALIPSDWTLEKAQESMESAAFNPGLAPVRPDDAFGYRCHTTGSEWYAMSSVWCESGETMECLLSEYIEIPLMKSPLDNEQAILSLQSTDNC